MKFPTEQDHKENIRLLEVAVESPRYLSNLQEVVIDNRSFLTNLAERVLLQITNNLTKDERKIVSQTCRSNYDFISKFYWNSLYGRLIHFSDSMDKKSDQLNKDVTTFKKLQALSYSSFFNWSLFDISIPFLMIDYLYLISNQGPYTPYIFWMALIASALLFEHIANETGEILYYNAIRHNQPLLPQARLHLDELLKNNFLLAPLFQEKDSNELSAQLIALLVKADFNESNGYIRVGRISESDAQLYKDKNPRMMMLTDQQANDFKIPQQDDLKLLHYVPSAVLNEIIDKHIRVLSEIRAEFKSYQDTLVGSNKSAVDLNEIKKPEHRKYLIGFFDQWNSNHARDNSKSIPYKMTM